MWTLWKTARCAVFQIPVGALFGVHRNGSVHTLRRAARLSKPMAIKPELKGCSRQKLGSLPRALLFNAVWVPEVQ